MFERRLKQLRENRNMLQKELAYALNTTAQTISSWEIGRTKPDYDMLIKIASYFNVSIDFLLGNEEYAKTFQQKNNEKEILKQLLVKNGYMRNNEDLSNEELERLMKFVTTNKELLKNK